MPKKKVLDREHELPKAVRTILRSCKKNSDLEVFESSPKHIHENPEKWTIVDLFLRQFLNNLVDGFGLYNVPKMYTYLCKHKAVLMKYQLVSESAVNNSGYTLWENYDFVRGANDDEAIKRMSAIFNKIDKAIKKHIREQQAKYHEDL